MPEQLINEGADPAADYSQQRIRAYAGGVRDDKPSYNADAKPDQDLE
jgi:hypothetical protein